MVNTVICPTNIMHVTAEMGLQACLLCCCVQWATQGLFGLVRRAVRLLSTLCGCQDPSARRQRFRCDARFLCDKGKIVCQDSRKVIICRRSRPAIRSGRWPGIWATAAEWGGIPLQSSWDKRRVLVKAEVTRGNSITLRHSQPGKRHQRL